MNRQEYDILNNLMLKPYSTQRNLAEDCGHSVGVVNRSIRKLTEEGYLNAQAGLTPKAAQLFAQSTPKNAIILAAGFGMRMVPINMETPKGLLEVKGQTLIERIITQLHEAGIRKIYVVVGFMKEQYEYLIDAYNVELIVNPEYASKNNLHSLKRVLKYLSNSYIIPCDIWCKSNPFSRYELYSWYMVSDQMDAESSIRVNRKLELVTVPESAHGNGMLGISYITEELAGVVREKLLALSKDSKFDGSFWEEALYQKNRMIVEPKVVSAADVVEINTYEQLRELDRGSIQLQTNAISTIAQAMGVKADEITNIEVLKKGMTNRSFLFVCKGQKYIMRIPGEGTDQLINRAEEAAVYKQIGGHGICDDIFYINPANGYKITRYWEGARVCDPLNEQDLRRCMEKLREFHGFGLKVEHCFDIFQQIEFYESLWNGTKSAYHDYPQTKKQVLSLKPFIDKHHSPYVLTHIDAVPDNFLFTADEEGNEHVRLIDWEYAGMQDPHVDIAMFCIYSMYDRQQIDRLIDLYFRDGCSRETRVKIYCYIACCGLLWSNWCEYKRQLGVEFGEYSLRQYRYAKEYCKIVQEEWKRKEDESRCIQ